MNTKKYTVFEASIIGLLVGVIVSTYITFVANTGGFLGEIIGWVSLRPVTAYFPFTDNYLLVASFVFFILVYVVYGAFVGLIIKNITKPRRIIVPLILLAGAVMTEQILGAGLVVGAPDNATFQTAAIVHIIAKAPAMPEQYFGAATSTEATGDLNGDGKADIAFLIHRDDTARGALYYVTAALATSTGHTGTNLVFLGDKVKPLDISIADNTITVDYFSVTTSGDLVSTTTHQFYARLNDKGILEQASTSTALVSPVI